MTRAITTTGGNGHVALSLVRHELLVEDWLRHVALAVEAGQRSQATLTAFRSWIRPWLAFLAQEAAPPTSLTVQRFLGWFRPGRQPATVNAALQATRACYAWAETQNRYPAIAYGIPLLRVARHGPLPVLSPAQVAAAAFAAGEPRRHLRALGAQERLLEHVRAARDEALIRCLYATGARVVSFIRADVADYRRTDDPPSLVHQPKGHGAKDARAFLPPHAAETLDRYLDARLAALGALPGPLWIGLKPRVGSRLTGSSIHRLVTHALQQAGLRPPPTRDRPRTHRSCSPHTLRRSAITQVVAAEGLEAGQILAGHASATTTRQAYARVQTQQVLEASSLLVDLPEDVDTAESNRAELDVPADQVLP